MVFPWAAVAQAFATEAGTQAGSSVMGKVLGGLGFGGKSKKGPDWDDQRAMNRQQIQDHWNTTMEMAKAHGIHPLAALGVPSSPSAPFVVGDDRANDFRSMSDLGQNLSRAFDATRNAEERHNVRMQVLQEDRGELENTLLRSQIASMNAQLGPPLPTPRTIWSRDRDGKLTEVLNPDLGDNEMMMMQDWITRSFPQDLRNMTERTGSRVRDMLTSPRSPGGIISRYLRGR